MNNLTSIDKIKYEKADDSKIRDHRSFKKLVCILIKITIVLICELFKSAISLFRPQKLENISGKLCLITGGANGLGRSLALKFAEQKCRIVIVDILDTDDAVKEIIETYGVDCRGFKCDVSDFEALKKIKTEIESSMGSVDILVNNAGLLFSGTLDSCNIESIEKCVAVNLTSQFMTVKLFLPKMIEKRHGKIVAISSVISIVTAPLTSIYCATKAGLNGFMEALYDDLCLDDFEDDIKLTTVFPYYIITRKQLGDLMEECDSLIPPLSPEYVAERIVDGVMKRKRKITLYSYFLHLFLYLPEKVKKYAMLSTTNIKAYKKKHYGRKMELNN